MAMTARPTSPSGRDVDTSWCANPLVAWLLAEGSNVSSATELVARLATRLVEAGLPLWRLVCLIRTLHPQVIGVRYVWRRDSGISEEFAPLHDDLHTLHYPDSPMAAILDGTLASIRQRLDVPGIKLEFPIFQKLRTQGATDYVAMPLPFSGEQTNAIAFASHRPGGFMTSELRELYEMLPLLARLLEVHTLRHTAKTLLDTYLGRHTGERVLNGLIERGDGEDIHAAIWFCDLRDSTRMAETMSRQAFLAILNDFFDCTAGAVLDHGGEVLRFIGDAALAIFPTGAVSTAAGRGCCDNEAACHAALAAAVDAQARMQALNRRRGQNGEPPLGFGLGLHMGDVMYGNIGVPGRLEFTVIGAAANEAARLQGLCKWLNRSVLISAEFEHCIPGELVSLGRHRLRGVSTPQEVFTLRDGAEPG
ncbi:MAG: adenylate/guanylate cyclase domain-containing protein [Gammaproteobacteria bacterium]|nr:adenylate/guanylate cyclase domain-containing protein [Gammaproteobacteria bacterium]